MGGKYEVIGWRYRTDLCGKSAIRHFDEYTNSWFQMRKWKHECKKKYDAVTVITRKCWERKKKM